MRDNPDLLETTQKLEAIQKYVERQLHPAEGAFVLPQTSVPACLASKALWAAFISWSFGPETKVSNKIHAIFGGAAGLLFGGNSFYGAYFGTKAILREIDINVTNILNAMNSDSLSQDVILRVSQQIKHIPTKPPQPSSWSQIINVMFAFYTATITGFTYSGAIRDAVKLEPCKPDQPCSGISADVVFPMITTLAILWGICALLLAHYGQREQAFLSRVNNKLKDLLIENPKLSEEVNKHVVFVPISDERRENTSLLGGNTSLSSLQNLNRDDDRDSTTSYTQPPPPSPKK